ncbi:MAG: hypothetical protein EOP53_06775 [Sphingobacteriales bacterium]|nr:MAG: hypothetical protein EOP53_06775 [Sphingobacteriales bacterium]
MKKFYLLFAVLILAILGGTVAFFYVWNKPKVSIAKTAPAFSIATSQLAAEFSKDSASANKKYLNKVISITGKVTEMETDAAGFVSLIFNEAGVDIQCTLDSAANTKAANRNLQDSVRIKGNYVGYLNDDIFGLQVKLNNCVTE